MRDGAIDLANPGWVENVWAPVPGHTVVEWIMDSSLKIAVQAPPHELAEARAFPDASFPGLMPLDSLAEVQILKP